MVVVEIVCDGVEFCLSINFDLIDLTFLDLFYLFIEISRETCQAVRVELQGL